MRDWKAHLYMCTACGIRYKHRKSLNKHWRDKHHCSLELPPPALQPQEQLTGRKRGFAEMVQDDGPSSGEVPDEDAVGPAAKRCASLLSPEEHDKAIRILSNNGTALSKFVRLALTQHPDHNEITPAGGGGGGGGGGADRPPVLSPQVPTESHGLDEVDGPLDLTLASTPVCGGLKLEGGQAPIDLSGARAIVSSASAFTRVLGVKNVEGEATPKVMKLENGLDRVGTPSSSRIAAPERVLGTSTPIRERRPVKVCFYFSH